MNHNSAPSPADIPNTNNAAAPSAAPPLAGRHIAITRPLEQAEALATLLTAQGARVTPLASIAIAPLADTTALDTALRALHSYDWLILTSVNGVHAVSQRLAALQQTWRPATGQRRPRIAVIGPATARALSDAGVTPDLLPDEYIAEAILAALIAHGPLTGQRILLLRADIARKALAADLRAHGALVDEVPAYRTLNHPPDAQALRALLDHDRPHAITFTSSSTVRGLMESLASIGRPPHEALAGAMLACIGPITAATLREYHLEPDIVAREYTMPGLVAALVERLAPAVPPAVAQPPHHPHPTNREDV